MSKDQYFSAVDRYRCIMQPDRPHFSSGAAIVISILMMIASVVLCVPKFVTATVSCFESKYVELDVLNLFKKLAIFIQILKTRIFWIFIGSTISTSWWAIIARTAVFCDMWRYLGWHVQPYVQNSIQSNCLVHSIYLSSATCILPLCVNLYENKEQAPGNEISKAACRSLKIYIYAYSIFENT